jgi:hypothetical protein
VLAGLAAVILSALVLAGCGGSSSVSLDKQTAGGLADLCLQSGALPGSESSTVPNQMAWAADVRPKVMDDITTACTNLSDAGVQPTFP